MWTIVHRAEHAITCSAVRFSLHMQRPGYTGLSDTQCALALQRGNIKMRAQGYAPHPPLETCLGTALASKPSC